MEAPRSGWLESYRLRTVRIGTRTGFLAVLSVCVFRALPGGDGIPLPLFLGLAGAAAVWTLTAMFAPWERLFASNVGVRAMSVWSIGNIALITTAVAIAGDENPSLFMLYGLTTLFFAAVYPVRVQLGLLAFTAACYLSVARFTAPAISPADNFLFLSALALIALLASYLAQELMQRMYAQGDVQERLSRELKDLQQADEVLRAISELGSDYVYSISIREDGTMEWDWVSDAYERVTGYTPEETVERGGWLFFIHPEDVPRVVEGYEHLMAGEPRDDEVRIITKSGEIRHIQSYVEPVWDEAAGRVVRYYGAVQDITERKEDEEALRRADAQRRELLSHLVRAKEEERGRLASDIHDDSIQVMTSIAVELERHARKTNDPGLKASLTSLEESLRSAIGRLRAMIFELKPLVLIEEGLRSALYLLLETQRQDTGIEFELQDSLTGEPPDEVRVALYRIAQEALTNVRKHADATKIRVHLSEAEGGITLQVEDNGKGFDVAAHGVAIPGHIGLTEMRERVEMMGGRFRIGSVEPHGVMVEAWVPDPIAARANDQPPLPLSVPT